ncbi:MAG: hypothetical protein JNL56_14705 [Alphaproteobacteria bacterium]|nr:hypothetical protein [Alphaproteobacteria bacterium]
MRFDLKVACAVLALAAMPAVAGEAAGPSVGHPLSPLCDLICGGAWSPDHPPYPDEIRTTKSYEWDAETRTVRGLEISTGGIAGIRIEVAVTFAYDEAADALTVTRTKADAAPVAGTVAIGADGFQMRFPAPDGSGGAMITVVRFEGADVWIERSEILEDGRSTLGGEQRFRRKPE